MGALMRELDWADTPIGPPERWPESLRTAVSICLSSRFPILLLWGPELVMLYNDAFRPILGTTKHPGAMGGRGEEIWTEVWEVVGPLLQAVLERGEATWFEDQPLLLDRHGYLEETHFMFSYSPVRDESGAVLGIFCAVAETTDRVLADRRLRTVTELATRTAEAQTVAEVCERAVEALATNPDDLPFVRLALGDTICTSGDDDAGASPLVLPVRGGGELLVRASPHRELDAGYREFFRLLTNQIAAAAATAAGLEDERRRADALAELDRAKTDFFSNVSHEFRTPLTLMLGPLADALADAAEPLPPGQRERVETARRSALRLLRLVNALLDFSRLEAGGTEPMIAPVDLTALVSEAAGGFRPLMESAGLKLETVHAHASVTVLADREMTEKVVLNLLSNAYKFTLRGGVRVTVGTQGDRGVLMVADSGTGIPPSDLPHVFDRFRRVRGAEARSHEGTGIGLALVHELVRLMGGSVAVESRLGAGTTFTVELPLAGAPATARPAAPSEEAAGALAEAARWDARVTPQPGARVLVVDDNADMRDYLTRLLAPHWAVEGAADGAAALERARRGGLDLVVTDVMLPRLDGFGLLRELRADPATRRIPVIMVSARASEDTAVQGLDAGADDYLAKPFSAGELVARVRSHLELARLREERARRAEDVAETLQRSLLPERLPTLPELQLAGRYVPAGGELRVGGDWYDAIPLADGHVVLAIGDVAGHGIRAATAMGQVSHALRAYASEGHGPAALLRRLDALVTAGGIDMVTCQLALLDPVTGHLRWASAGHLPALVVADGAARRLEGPVCHPLGVVPASRYEESATQLGDGESLVLYTDGLVERRGEDIDAGIDALAAALDGGPPDAGLRRGAGPAARRRAAARRRGAAHRPPAAADRAARGAGRTGRAGAAARAAPLAGGVAAGQRGHRPSRGRPGAGRPRGRDERGRARPRRAAGDGRAPRRPGRRRGRGRGARHGPLGRRAEPRRPRPRAPADAHARRRRGRGAGRSRHRCQDADALVSHLANLFVWQRDNVVVAGVTGEIDVSNAAELEASVTREIVRETAGLVMDLGGLDFMDSSGVHMLFHLARRLERRGLGFALVLPPDSIPRRVLELSGPHPRRWIHRPRRRP